MDKNKILELLARKMAGEASHRELEELRELMMRFPDAVYYEEFLAQVWTQSTAIEGETVDAEKAYQLHRSKYASEFNRKKKLIGSLVFLLAITLLSLLYFYHDNTPGTTIDIVAGKGVRKKVTLPDGTLVWLNANSKLSYPADLNDKPKRKVYLIGEAFFDVAHHQSHPFIVRTEKFSVKVLGTSFNVRAYLVDKKSEATLIRGAIELLVHSRPKQKILLNPSEKFAIEDNKTSELSNSQKNLKHPDLTLTIEKIQPMRIGEMQYIEEVAWKDSLLVFKDESFEDLKPKLERWYELKVTIQASVPESYRFTGVLKNEDIKEALTAMQLIKPFKFKLLANEVIIY
ncbi:ferric-dicitrate binding protein FerR (iron transport regulator) [Pedobacter sp. CAN_A7]|uniref:FecR family protein n=1 Tax=Pedobacter sp. CAN_A7 TaxID=2787722 RepID=UPI0018C9ED23